MTSELPRLTLFGLRFIDAPDVGVVADALLERRGIDTTRDDALPVVFTPNVDVLVHLDRDDSPQLAAIGPRAGYVLADGQPVVWASRLLGRPLQTRLAGSDLVAELWPRLARENRHALVVANGEQVARLLRAEHPGATVVVAPMLPDEAAIEMFAKECVAACGERVPEMVFVGIGYPNLYGLIAPLLRLWGDGAPPLHFAIGGSFEMYYGLRRRSPVWMQRIGMEWFFRFLQEPRRLFRRYFIDDVAFARIVWDEHRRQRRENHPTARTTRPAGRVLPGPWNRRDHDDDVAQPAS